MNDLMEDFDITGQSMLVSVGKTTVIIYEPILDHQGIYLRRLGLWLGKTGCQEKRKARLFRRYIYFY